MRLKPIPTTPRQCNITESCVYRVNGVCADPRIHSGNSDAICFSMPSSEILQNLEEIKNDTPPEMWVITRERVRAGKIPFKIAPLEWVRVESTGKPWAVKAYRSAKYPDVIYRLKDCFMSAQDADRQIDKIIADEIYHEEARLRELKTKMRKAKKDFQSFIN